MRAHYVHGIESQALLDPDGAAWQGVRPEAVALMGTPIGLQPTPVIQVTYATRQIGAITEVSVSAAHDGQSLAFRIEWGDGSENRTIGDTNAFPDGAAVLLPGVAGAPLITMGGPGLPVNAWYWRADEEGGRQVVAEGVGTSRTLDTELVKTRSSWKGGRWRVVIARALRIDTAEPVAQLQPGLASQFGVAVWEGEHGERGGIKAFSGDWRPLQLDGPPTARR